MPVVFLVLTMFFYGGPPLGVVVLQPGVSLETCQQSAPAFAAQAYEAGKRTNDKVQDVQAICVAQKPAEHA